MLCVTNMLLHGIDDPSFVRHDNTFARPYIGWGSKDRVDIVLTNPPFRRQRGGRHREQLSAAFPHAGDGGSVPRSHHPAVEAPRAGCSGAAGRLVVRGRCEDPTEGAPDGGVQPPHHRSIAQLRISGPTPPSARICCSSRRGSRHGISGSTSTWCRRGRRLIP